MKRLQLYILVFFLTLSVPLGYFVLLTYRGLEQEEISALRYFAETLFDEMEQGLSVLVLKEEQRAVDEYNFYYSPPDAPGLAGPVPSPLSLPPEQNFILGYLQNNPDGSFQTPLVKTASSEDGAKTATVEQLRRVNDAFNLKRTSGREPVETPQQPLVMKTKEKIAPKFAENYLNPERSKKQKSRLGQEEKRVEKITPRQALSVAQNKNELLSEESIRDSDLEQMQASAPEKDGLRKSESESPAGSLMYGRGSVSTAPDTGESSAPDMGEDRNRETLQVEVAPMQAVFINDTEIFVFRRVMLDNRIYRQGFVLLAEPFLNYLMKTHFRQQPMARFTRLRIEVLNSGGHAASVQYGDTAAHPKFLLERVFPRPFSFVHAVLTCERIPKSAGRRTLSIMLAVLAGIVILGLFAIYQSARTVVDLSERRARFVSSVTHELKTPLTNIRMYIEMLEQGIARTPEREMEYFRVLDSESARLSRLITNVLEFSKLEKKALRPDLRQGDFREVIDEVEQVMGEKLRQEGFTPDVNLENLCPFVYDREVMIQVMINLMENSMKFGANSKEKIIRIRFDSDKKNMNIRVSDTGPGIPRHALKKVFDDFYRVESPLTQHTRGTGIGLAFVKKFIAASNGTVSAANNPGPGCTITISLPLEFRGKKKSDDHKTDLVLTSAI